MTPAALTRYVGRSGNGYAQYRASRLYANPCNFGGKVQGANVIYERSRPKSITNEQYFRNFGSQAGMAMRQRADMTARLLKGEQVDPHRCLFLNPEIPHLEDIMADMAQAEFEDSTGKTRIEKQPHGPGEPKPPSPPTYSIVAD